MIAVQRRSGLYRQDEVALTASRRPAPLSIFQVRTRNVWATAEAKQGYRRTVKQISRQLGVFSAVALLSAAAISARTADAQRSRVSAGFFSGGVVSGTVVDTEGVPQMGALVQLLLPDTSLAASALTDAHGRYHLSDLRPGSYRVRVSAALFLPDVRHKLLVAGGSRSVVNLTLSSVLATSQWLPATRRTSADAEDDWMWTLRSSTMRPVLRLVDRDANAVLGVSSSASEVRELRTQGRLAMHQNDGGFARGGAHQVLSLERRSDDKSSSFLRADFSGPRTPFPVAPSADLAAGWERRFPVGTISRSTIAYSSHPEILGSHASNGLQTVVLRNGERMELGDALRVDVGSVFREVNLSGNVAALEPFLKIAVRPSDGVVIAYSFTASRGTESLDDLDRVQPAMPVATMRGSQLRLERARHESLSLAHRTVNHGSVEVAVYRDSIHNPVVAGTGALPVSDAALASTLVDPTTQSFLVGVRDFDASGVRMLLHQPINGAVSLQAAFSTGRALVSGAGARRTLADIVNAVDDQSSMTATLALDAHSVRSGTRLRAGYRWQPADTVSAVDEFSSSDETAYLHCKLRQSLRAIRVLPEGLEAVVDVQNLLAQGYRPFVSQDGHTLYLAQAPRVLQAGVSLTF